MKIIIGVWHTEKNVGRRSTLREFAKMLMEKHPFAEIICPECNGEKQEVIPDTGDFRLVLKIKDKTIGIERKINSYNKPSVQLQDLIKTHKCDIIVCATIGKGATTDAVDDTEDSGFHIIWTSPYQILLPQFEQKMNKLKAKHLIDMINCMEVAGL